MFTFIYLKGIVPGQKQTDAALVYFVETKSVVPELHSIRFGCPCSKTDFYLNSKSDSKEYWYKMDGINNMSEEFHPFINAATHL